MCSGNFQLFQIGKQVLLPVSLLLQQTVYDKEAELDLMEHTVQVVVGMWKSR